MFKNEEKKEAKKAEEIRKHILELLVKQGNQLADLSVTFDDGIVTLAGNCDSTKTRDKALLMAKNVEGVKDVKDGGLRVPDAAAPVPEPAAAPDQTPVQAPASSPFAAAAGFAAQAASRAAAPAAPQPAPQAPVQATQPVTPPPATPQPQAQPAVAETIYTIQAGDNLSKIAKKFYGDANKYMAIFEANKDTLKDPDKIFPGKQIRIPKL